MEKGLEKKDTAHIQVIEGSKTKQEIIKARILTTEEADREIASTFKENSKQLHKNGV